MLRHFTLGVLFFYAVCGKSQSLFEKTYNIFPYFDFTASVQQTTDGGYFASGWGGLGSNTDIFMIKTDTNGDTLWVKTYGGLDHEERGFARQTADGGYIITGSTTIGASNVELWLIKTDTNGNIQWNTVYSAGPLMDYGMCVQQTTDGGYIVAGTRTWNSNNYDIWLIKTDNIGNIVWDSLYGGLGKEVAVAVKQTSDNGYIIAGYTSGFGAGLSDYYLIKTDSVGNSQWVKTYGTAGNDDASDVSQTTDGGFIITGRWDSVGNIIKTNSAGDTIWTRILNIPAVQIVQTDDGGYAAISRIDNGFPTYGDMNLIKINGSGNILWTRSYNNDSLSVTGSFEEGRAIGKTNDGGFILAGGTGFAGYDVYLVKTDSLGNIDTITTGITSNSILPDEIKAYPNPFTYELIIKGTKQKGEIIVFDLTGKEIIRQKAADNETKLFTKQLTNGFYFLNYKEENKSTNIKLFKL